MDSEIYDSHSLVKITSDTKEGAINGVSAVIGYKIIEMKQFYLENSEGSYEIEDL